MVKMCHNPIHLTNHKSQRWSRSVQTTLLPFLFKKRLKQQKNCIEVVNSFVSVSMIKICHNSKHLTNYISQRQIRRVQTTFIPIFIQKRLKPKTNCLKAVNCLVSVSMVIMCHNLIHFNTYKRQRGISCVQTTLRPIVSQKRLKPTKNCLESVNSFVSISIVNMCHYIMHLTNNKSQRWNRSVQTTPFIPKEAKTNKKMPRSNKSLFQCFYGQNVSQSYVFD